MNDIICSYCFCHLSSCVILALNNLHHPIILRIYAFSSVSDRQYSRNSSTFIVSINLVFGF